MERKFCILENRQVLILLMKLHFVIGGESTVLCAELEATNTDHNKTHTWHRHDYIPVIFHHHQNQISQTITINCVYSKLYGNTKTSGLLTKGLL